MSTTADELRQIADVVCLEDSERLTAIASELEALEAQIRRIDETLARRPALARYEDRCGKIEHAINTARKVDELEAKVAELEKDKARLDWLEKFFQNVGTPFIGFNDDSDIEDDEGMIPVGFRIVFGESCNPKAVYVEDSLRKAIDSAIEAMKGEQ